ncbi:MAG: TetR/AcrR family transcriptional regulator [Butyrivibrio sp.]|nr:TetR/AcrR family transcriptional regulator [Butyrivibrio sp.]
MDENQRKILETVIVEFNNKGMKFTMDDVAKDLHMSKKTIYKEFGDKEDLFNKMVDYCFSSIKEKEAEILSDPNLTTVERISKLLICLPDNYQHIDFRKIYQVKDKYPHIYARVAQRLENDWEDTIALLQQGMDEGVIKKMPIPVIKLVVEASIEKFLTSEVLIETGTNYEEALDIMIEMLMNGIAVDK